MVEILITQNTKNGRKELILIKDKNFIHLQKEEVEKLSKFFFARLNSQEKSTVHTGVPDTFADESEVKSCQTAHDSTKDNSIKQLLDKDYEGMIQKDKGIVEWRNKDGKKGI